MKSLIALSMHKAGSSIADRILGEFCRERGYRIERISDGWSTSPVPEGQMYRDYQSRMEADGVYYGIARGAYVAHMPIIDTLRTVVQVRDPRDCITSAYFSYARSHVPPEDPQKRAAFEADRANIAAMTIDAFALAHIEDYTRRLRILGDIIDRHDDVLLLRYEDMVLDTPAWLRSIADYLDQPVEGGLARRLARMADFTVEGEDPDRHKRQVLPGDHARKLAPETIATLREAFAAPLARFGYAA